MDIETPQIYSTYQHIFVFSQMKHKKILFNQLFPTRLQRDAPAIVIIDTHKPLCIYAKNLNQNLRSIFEEHGNCEIFYRFISPLKFHNFKYLLGNQVVYQGRL